MFATTADCAAACDAVVAELLLAAGTDAPPVDAVAIAARLDWPILWDCSQTGRARMQRLNGQPTLFVRPEDRPERLQWAIAHEIGEATAWQVCRRLDLSVEDVGPRQREELASQIARRLLLPTDWFFAGEGDLTALKTRFSTASHELIAWRWLDGETPTVVTIFDRGAISRRRCNFAAQAPAICTLETECADEARATGIVSQRLWQQTRACAWPIHEPDWQREIVRTIMDGV